MIILFSSKALKSYSSYKGVFSFKSLIFKNILVLCGMLIQIDGATAWKALLLKLVELYGRCKRIELIVDQKKIGGEIK